MLTVYLAAAAGTLLAWLVLAAVFVGVGALALRPFRARLAGADNLFRAFWTGWAATICFLQVWHLWLPVDSRAALLPALAGAVGLGASFRPVADFAAHILRERRALALLLAGLLAAAALAAQTPLFLYDAGVYHLSAIRWANSFPIVPGLGNLNARLGFNSSLFLYHAALNVGPLAGKSHHVAVGLLAIVLLTQLLASLARIIRDRPPPSEQPVDYFRALLLVPALIAVSQVGLSTTNTDLPVFMLEVVVSAELLALLREDAADRRRLLSRLFFLTLVAATGVTAKLSFAVFGAAAVAVALAILLARHRRDLPFVGGAWALAGGVALATLGPWLARGVILSGYPFYPWAGAAVPVDWKVPPPTARVEEAIIREWARSPDGLETAIRDEGQVFLLPLALGLVTPAAAVLLRGRAAGAVWLCLLPPWVGIAAWCYLAPLPRFAGALIWIAAAAAVTLVLPALRPAARWALVVLVCGVPLAMNARQVSRLARTPLFLAQGRWRGVEDIRRVPLSVFTTSSGLQVYAPVEGDQVWDAPLPATPYPDPNLRLRHPPDLGAGFWKE